MRTLPTTMVQALAPSRHCSPDASGNTPGVRRRCDSRSREEDRQFCSAGDEFRPTEAFPLLPPGANPYPLVESGGRPPPAAIIGGGVRARRYAALYPISTQISCNAYTYSADFDIGDDTIGRNCACRPQRCPRLCLQP
jgi:hypothetical protein